MEVKIVLLVLLGLLGYSSAQSASCQYLNSSIGYTCYLSMVNPLGAEFDTIEGEHLDGFTNDDVAMVYSWEGSSVNVPEAICRQFPNLVQLDLAFFGITTITEQSFSGCANTNFLRLWWNQITDLPLNTFANNPLLTYLDLDGNNLTTLPENVFQNLANLEILEIRNNPFESIPAGIFNGLSALTTLYMSNVRITQVNPEWFAPTTNLQTLLLYNNQITSFNENSFSTLTSLLQLDIGINPLTAPIPANTFAPLTSLIYIYLDNLRLTEVNVAWFNGLDNLMVLALYSNQIASLAENTFEGLSNLWVLDLDYNRQISDLPDGVFSGLTQLNSLYLSSLSLWLVRPNWFATLPNLQFLMLNFNLIEDLPPAAFVALNNLQYLGLWANNIKTLERGYFGNLNRLYYLDLDENTVNGLDQRVFDDAVNLSIFYFWNNVCGSGSFFNFNENRIQNYQRLNRCFRNFEFSVETVTEGDMNYRFYRFPNPGIMARIDTNSEIHISLNPVDFEAIPRIEIHIGVEGNTRSRIIRSSLDGDEVVVDIPTPDIVRPIGWTGFRVIYSNFVVLVLREGEQWPFMGFQMVDFIRINNYGIRTPGYVASWSILPLEADGT